MVGLPSAGSHTQPAMHAVTQDDVLSASSVLAMLSFFAVDSPGAASDSTPAEQPVAVIVARAANQHPQTERNTALIVIPPTPKFGARSLRTNQRDRPTSRIETTSARRDEVVCCKSFASMFRNAHSRVMCALHGVWRCE